MNINEYIQNVRMALGSNRSTWFPMEKSSRKKQNIRLGHELGYGLGAYDNWEKSVGSTYGILVVAHSLDSVGVVIDAKEWVGAIAYGVQQYKDSLIRIW